jgi:cytochrome c peroxidase
LKHMFLVQIGGVLSLAFLLALASPSIQAAADEIAVAAEKTRVLQLPDPPCSYENVQLPAHFKKAAVRRFDNTPSDNPVTDAGAALGRALFYDTRLSASKTIACASCHHQKHAFSDSARFSKGHDGKPTDRNSMPLVNVRFYPTGKFFWDERARTLEQQVLMPIQNKLEMGQDLQNLIGMLGNDAAYPGLYRKAFGDPKVTKERTAKALAQFVRALISYQSKYDQGLAKVESVDDAFPNFTAKENRGKTLFLRHCARCHLPNGQGAIFQLLRPQNNGLDATAKVADLGVADVTFNRFQAGQFKSPSLRNVEYTGPYMHDGRFATLEQVIDHYSTGVKLHPNLDPQLRGPRRRLDLDRPQKEALVAFLKTLSDPTFITDPKFSDPFVTK